MADSKRLQIMAVGLRGFPNIQGGIETHAQHLYPELVKLGCDVEVLVRRPYVTADRYTWKGVQMKALWSPTATGLETLVHSFLGVCYAIVCRPDVLHIHAVGPALFAPLARLFGLKVVMTHHGMDYQRQKWGRFAKFVLRMGEKLGIKYSHVCITVSRSIKSLLEQTYGSDLNIYAIPNGVNIPEQVKSQRILTQFGLKKQQYFLMVSRFVPEKRQDDLIEAFLASNQKDKRKLVLVGDNTLGSKAYLDKIHALAQRHPNIVFTGFQTGEELSSLYTHAECFFLPSSHEGLPIALLEALSYGLYAVVSDIPAHLEMELESAHYFQLGNISQLAERINQIPKGGLTGKDKAKVIAGIEESFDWVEIAGETLRAIENITK
ncbi:MAG: glycosyltransferase family 4 protein [Ghiorsea sp.]|nr:glycosyltransferase family 4 protein [Ghiorsea sp.]